MGLVRLGVRMMMLLERLSDLQESRGEEAVQADVERESFSKCRKTSKLELYLSTVPLFNSLALATTYSLRSWLGTSPATHRIPLKRISSYLCFT